MATTVPGALLHVASAINRSDDGGFGTNTARQTAIGSRATRHQIGGLPTGWDPIIHSSVRALVSGQEPRGAAIPSSSSR
jgi:hypothetical protein